MKTIPCVDEILVRGLDDWIQAAEVAYVSRLCGKVKTLDDTRNLSIDVIGELLKRHLVEIGDVSDDGFKAWDISEVSAVEKVEASWRNLTRGPELGELFWLNLTESGQRLATQIWEQRKEMESRAK